MSLDLLCQDPMKMKSCSSKKISQTLAGLSLAVSLTVSPVVHAENLCRSLFQQVERVAIPQWRFHQATQTLRATLSGKLATVWRSEWKTKLSTPQSNRYVLEMLHKFLTPETQQYVLRGLDPIHEGFTRKVHERMAELQKAQRLLEGDELLIRDAPPPKGAQDTTFTYYTKPLVGSQGEGKHQLRIRTYLRTVHLEQIPLGDSVQGFDSAGNNVVISRTDQGFRVEVKTDQKIISESFLTMAEVKQSVSATRTLFAPHGKSLKLEIKTALSDQIAGDKFPLLAGPHMVQKLDVTLSLSQVSALFAPLKGTSAPERRSESQARLAALKEELIAAQPSSAERTKAVFEVLGEGVLNNPNYLFIEGATVYHRTAFESKSGFQTTIDRDQGVYAGNMNAADQLKSPLAVLAENSLITTGVEDARHVELKIPVTSIQGSVGIIFADPAAAPSSQSAALDQRNEEAARIYERYVRSIDHPGKFNFLRTRDSH